MRVIYVVHESRGRLRLRLSWLREQKEEAERIADRIGALGGVDSVEVRPFTGSVLCEYDPEELQPARIIQELRSHLDVELVVGLGEERPAQVEREVVKIALASGSGVARAATQFIEELDLAVLRATNGGINLGTLAALGFIGAGMAEIVGKGKLPLPPWFNLGWWAFRTFSISEKRTIDGVRSSFQGEIVAAERQG